MTCEECGQEATGRAERWEALLIDLDDDGQDEIVFYCPVCAEREFHEVRSLPVGERPPTSVCRGSDDASQNQTACTWAVAWISSADRCESSLPPNLTHGRCFVNT